jgi:hypothetical protein
MKSFVAMYAGTSPTSNLATATSADIFDVYAAMLAHVHPDIVTLFL